MHSKDPDPRSEDSRSRIDDHRERAVRVGSLLANEKGQQVSPASLTVFGIPVVSRYGLCWEIQEMLAFCRRVADAGGATYITEVFYDSKACIASITFEPSAAANSNIVREIEAIADQVLSQYHTQDGSISGNLPDDVE